MKIEIEDGKPVVKFKASERAALNDAPRLCQELGHWLRDEKMAELAVQLREQTAKYLGGATDGNSDE